MFTCYETNVRGGGGGLRRLATLLFSIALKIVVGWLVGTEDQKLCGLRSGWLCDRWIRDRMERLRRVIGWRSFGSSLGCTVDCSEMNSIKRGRCCC